MKGNRLYILLLAALPGAFHCLGCSQAASEALGLRGPKGTVALVQSVSDGQAETLTEYRRIELGTVTDDTGGNLPADFMGHFQRHFAEKLARSHLPDESAGRTLIARGRILHYEESELFGKIFGPLEEVIARIDLVDKETGRVLGTANCIGRTKERINLGVEKKAEGLAKSIVSWIERYYPKPETEE